MKRSILLASLTCLVASQNLPIIPNCSLSCLTAGVVHVGCALDDYKCACAKGKEVLSFITPCLTSKCSHGDQDEFRNVGLKYCASIGEPVAPPELEMQRKVHDRQVLSCTLSSCLVYLDIVALTSIAVSPSPWTWTGIYTPTIIIVPDPSTVTSTETGWYRTAPPVYTGAADSVKVHDVVAAGVAGLVGLVL
jgi:hypothetical protein